MTNWKTLLKEAFDARGEDFAKMKTTLSEEQLNRNFDDGFGGHEGDQFTAWGEKYVYFPVVYDGSEWVGSAPRNICDEITHHIGGE